jgi:effector-binding domain-containing protein
MTATDTHIIDLEPLYGSGIEVYAKWPDLTATIRATFDRLYKPGALAAGHGHNFILYSDETKDGGMLTIGVLDRQPGGVDPDVKAAHVPGGRVITAAHWGDYGQMRTTYDVLHAEVKAKGLKRIWKSLEVYGDWSDDPSKVRTDLYLYLAVGI